MNERLRDCPFCGGKAKIDKVMITVTGLGDGRYCAICQSCMANSGGRYETKEDAVEAWNARFRSWNLLMEWLDEIYPADIFTGVSGNIGPSIIVKLREIDALRKGTGSIK